MVDAPWSVSADRPTDQDLIEKFQMITEPILGETRASELRDLIWNLEQEPRAARLVDLATARGL